MSKENVVLFTKAAIENADLNERLVGTEKVDDWIKIAEGEGFEFTADEFCSVIGETIGKKVTPLNAVREYLAAGKEMGEGELSEKALETVVGGRRRHIIIMKPAFVQHTPRYIIGT
jgi:Nif11 domain